MKISLEEIINLGETQNVEFKTSLSSDKKAYKNLCGFINTDSAVGWVIFGVTPDKKIKGLSSNCNLDSAQRTMSQHIRQNFKPPIIPDINVDEYEGKKLIFLKAVRRPEIPYHEYKHEAYIRVGSELQKLSPSQKQQFVEKRHKGPWKCNTCGTIIANELSFFSVNGKGKNKRNYSCPDCCGSFKPIT